jgi:fructoselysine-6-P-deglycase FrlB-like protein
MSDTGPDAGRFLADLEAKPAALERLGRATAVREAITRIPTAVGRVVLLGMGSSRYAAEVAALRLRAQGVEAIAELASVATASPPGATTLAVAISATGASRETVAALERHAGRSRTVAITNVADSPLASMADLVIPLQAGPEPGGIACRTFQHTGLVLDALERRLTGQPDRLADLCARVAAATSDLLDRRRSWLPSVADALDGSDGVYVLAPAERLSSALQSALMVREGPRRPATGCETGDWCHVDVYLTRTLDYRALLLSGSAYDADALSWLEQRGSIVVAIGSDVTGATATVRYHGDQDADVALHAETLVAELLAHRWWASAHQGPHPAR